MKAFNTLKNFFLIREFLKFKEVFDYRGRISNETFISLHVMIGILSVVLSLLFYDIFFLSFPKIVFDSFGFMHFLFLSYVSLILLIKRLHDLNQSNWLVPFLIIHLFSSLADLPEFIKTLIYTYPSVGLFALVELTSGLLALIAFIYLCFRKGNPEKNQYGVLANYKKHSSLFLFGCYFFISAVISLELFSISGNALYIVKNSESIKNEKIERYDIFRVKILHKRMPDIFGDGNFILIDDKLLYEADPAFITENRILVTDKRAEKVLKKALSRNRTVKIYDGENKANIIRLVVSNNSFSDHMSVFEIDKSIGKPGELSARKKQILQILEKMNGIKFKKK